MADLCSSTPLNRCVLCLIGVEVGYIYLTHLYQALIDDAEQAGIRYSQHSRATTPHLTASMSSVSPRSNSTTDHEVTQLTAATIQQPTASFQCADDDQDVDNEVALLLNGYICLDTLSNATCVHGVIDPRSCCQRRQLQILW